MMMAPMLDLAICLSAVHLGFICELAYRHPHFRFDRIHTSTPPRNITKLLRVLLRL